MDLLLKNGMVVSERDEQLLSVGIDGETIVYVGSAALAPKASRTIDCEGKYVLPGLIDPHWHIGQQPGPPPPIERWLEDIGPESAAAARGGVTTVFSMYAREQSYPTIIRQLIGWGNAQSFIDFNFHPILQSAEHINEIEELYAMGVTSYKFFFDAYKGWEGDQIALHPLDAGLLDRAFAQIGRLGDSVGLVHAEDQDLIYELQEAMRATGRTDLAVWGESRPGIVELTKSFEAIQIAKRRNAAVYLVHIGSGEVADLVERERRRGFRVYGETCPHYLTHHQDMESQVGSWAKVNNAIKTEEDADQLWRAILSGGITNMGTDHVCWTRSEKEGGKGKHGNIWGAMPGIVGGTEHWLPVMVTYGVRAGRISMSDVVRITSTDNARTFGVYPRKGVLTPGSDADIVVVDPAKAVNVDAPSFYRSQAASEWSIYEGWRFEGLPVLTILRGAIVMEGGEVQGRPRGRYVMRPIMPTPSARVAEGASGTRRG